MVSMSSRMFSSRLLSSLPHPRRHHSNRARVFDVDSDSDTGPPSSTFHTELTQRLQKLNPHNDANTCSTSSKSDHQMVGLNWICQALDVVMATQQSVTEDLCTQAHASCSETQKMVQHCMEDSIKMLDVCSLLKETLAGVHAYVKASHLALKRLQGLKFMTRGDIQRAQHALLSANKEGDEQIKVTTPHSTKRLQACRSMLRRMGDNLPVPLTMHFEDFKTGSSMAALYGGQICTLFFLRLLSTALSSPRRSSSSITSPLHLPRQPVWGPALLDLQAQLHTELSQVAAQRRSCGTTLLPEMCRLKSSLHQIDESLRDLPSSKQARQDVQELVHSTSLLVDQLQNSMDRLHHQLVCISISLVEMQMVLHRLLV